MRNVFSLLLVLLLLLQQNLASPDLQVAPTCPTHPSPATCANPMSSVLHQTTKMMKAIVIHAAGGPSALRIESRAIPAVAPGHVRIRVKAFGLNRSEMFTRQGHSPVQFPRILGIEAVGIVDTAPDADFTPGDTVVTAMGGMGRNFDGGYAEYTVVPSSQVKAVRTSLSWATLGALPEMLQTAYGSLHRSLRIQSGETLLIRGGTTSIGLAAAAIARKANLTVIATTRRPDRTALLHDAGAHDVIIDDGAIAAEVKQRFPSGVDKVLELIGPLTFEDSMQALTEGGTACMTGIVGGTWTWTGTLIGAIPKARYLTSYGGSAEDLINMPFEELVRDVEEGRMKVSVGRVFDMEDIGEAHRIMEEEGAAGKMVVVT